MVACTTTPCKRAWLPTKEGLDQMIRTALALSSALVAADARPCGTVLAHGYQWRNGSVKNVKFNAMTTKRTARHLGNATT